MLFNLLSSSDANANANAGGGWVMWVVLGALLVVMIVANCFSNKKRRKQMEAEKEKRNAIKPGFKVMTIGGIVGIVHSVDDESNSFVLQTGTDENPNFIKFDKVAIYSSEDPFAPVETSADDSAISDDAAKDDVFDVDSKPADAVEQTADESSDDAANTDKE